MHKLKHLKAHQWKAKGLPHAWCRNDRVTLFCNYCNFSFRSREASEAARFAGRWYVRLKRYITNLQNEIDQELRLSEFRKEMQEELNRIEALERKVQQQLEEIQNSRFQNL